MHVARLSHFKPNHLITVITDVECNYDAPNICLRDFPFRMAGKVEMLYGHRFSSLLLEYAVTKVQINQKETFVRHPVLTLLRKHAV